VLFRSWTDVESGNFDGHSSGGISLQSLRGCPRQHWQIGQRRAADAGQHCKLVQLLVLIHTGALVNLCLCDDCDDVCGKCDGRDGGTLGDYVGGYSFCKTADWTFKKDFFKDLSQLAPML